MICMQIILNPLVPSATRSVVYRGVRAGQNKLKIKLVDFSKVRTNLSTQFFKKKSLETSGIY